MNIQEAQMQFISQYYHCDILVTRYSERTFKVFEMIPEMQEDIQDYDGKNLDKYVLQLRSINQLSDDECINVAKFQDWEFTDRKDICSSLKNSVRQMWVNFLTYQYLLRIGILLHFTYLDENNKPVTKNPDEIIAFGWAKYKEL